MKKIYAFSTLNIFIFLVTLLSFQQANAQTPPYFKGGGTGSNTIPMNATQCRAQLIYTPSDFNTLPPSGNISKIYWRNSTAATTATYTNFKVGFIQNSLTAFPDANFIPGMITALSEPSLTVPGNATAGGWYEISLPMPFLYDNTKTLIVEIVYTAKTGGHSSPSTTSTGFNKRLSNVTSSTATNGTLSTTYNDFGIEITTPTVCQSPPVQGQATATAAVCPGGAIFLSVTGGSLGTGQTYEWQSSSTLNGSFVTFSSSSQFPTLTVNPTVTTYYKALVTCSGQSTPSLPVEGTVIQPLNGSYTINPANPPSASNFQTFAAVINALNCGITGPVTITVAPGSGPYNEQVVLNAINGSSATNTLTFKGNMATVTSTATTTSERAIFKLNGADYVTIDSFTIVPAGATYGYGVQLLNDADNNVISHNVINVSTSSTSTNYEGIIITSTAGGLPTTTGDSKCDNNIISANKITGGAAGITLTANSSTNIINNNQVLNNEITDFYNYGIYVNGNNNTLIEGNDIKRPTRSSVTTFYGIYFSDSSTNCIINKNRIHHTSDGNTSSTSSNLGINFTGGDATPGNENIVTNNVIYHFTNNGLQYAIQSSGYDNLKIYHNSIMLGNETPGVGTSVTRGFYVSTAATGIDFRNNIIHISREGVQNKIGVDYVAGSAVTSNNNDIFVSSSTLAFFGANAGINYPTITDWRNATGKDLASKSIDPLYTDAANGNLKPTANALNNIGAPLGVLTDILGVARNVSSPDPGAYEFDAGACSSPPTAGNTVVSAPSPVCAGSSITFDLENNSIGQGQTYTWQSSLTQAGGYSNISTASSNSNFTYQPTATMWYQAAVTCGAETRTSTPIQISISPMLPAGTYTINPGGGVGGSNFINFSSAVAAIACGVTGPVTFNVTSGNYNEQVILPAIPGMSSSNPIVFNGNGAILEFVSANTSERATLKLNGTDYITFDNFMINANGSGTNDFGYAVQLVGDADNNTITNCTINATQNSTSSNFAGIVISGTGNSATSASTADGNNISGNTINGGFYGITVIGSTSTYIQNNIVSNNVFKDQYSYGIYVTGTNNILVERNELSRPARATVAAVNFIYFSGSSINARISKNRIHDPFGSNVAVTTASTGIQLSGTDATAGNENYVTNNVIYDFKSNGPVNGIYNNGSQFTRYYHNTIVFDDQASSTPNTNSTNGFWNGSDEPGVLFKNNIVLITRNDQSLKRNVLLSSTTTMVSDNNVLFLNRVNTGDYLVIQGSTNYATLAEWQASNGAQFDQHSKSVNPLFAGGGDFTPTENAINNMGTNVGITTDLINTPRFLPAPDPGALEFGNTTCTGSPNAGTITITPNLPVCAGALIKFTAANYSSGGNITYQWESSSTVNGTYTPVSGSLYYPDFQLFAPSNTTYYHLAVYCGTTKVTTAPSVLTVKQPLNGVYTINAGSSTNILTGGTNFQTFTEAADFLSCGIAGPVTFNVTPGTYNEQLILNEISGTSATNRIIFNGSGATISYLSTNTNERGIIKLNGTDYVTFNNFIIEAQGTTTAQYGYGVHLLNDADNNEINNCTITITQTPATVSSSSYAGIVVNSSAAGTATATGDSKCDNNTFSGNTISGGNIGISLIANSSTAMISNNKIINNTISEFYTNGIHLNGNNGAIVEGNNISRALRPNGTDFRGINMESVNLNSKISRNKIHDPFGGFVPGAAVVAIGIRMSTVDATVGNENIISNNFIYNFIGGVSTQNGILNNSSDNNKYYFNSIRLDDASATAGDTRGFYLQTTTVVGIDFRNNIISLGRSGPGAKQCIYFEPTSVTTYTINYNDYHNFAGAGTPVALVHMGSTDYATLASWQAASSKDLNSLETDPLFVNSTDLHLTNTSPVKDKGEYIAPVSTDIDGDLRALQADIGADEIPSTPIVYTFTGNGNFNDPANWSNNTVPPSPLPAYSEVVINPSGTAILNIPFVVEPGAKFTVKAGKNIVIQGNLTIQ